jgi:hypothetical protein
LALSGIAPLPVAPRERSVAPTLEGCARPGGYTANMADYQPSRMVTTNGLRGRNSIGVPEFDILDS